MITISNFFSGTLTTVDAVIGNFVSTAYANLVHANAVMITLLFTLYVMMLGFQFLYHHHHFNLSVIVRRLIVMLCVYGLVMNWQLYNHFVYNIFTNEPGNITHILIQSVGDPHSGSVIQALDDLYSAVCTASMGFLAEVGFSVSSLAFVFYAGIVYIIGTLMCVFALLLFIYSKMMMAVAFALGPVFILFVLWDSTKGMFSSWLNFLITTALVPVVTAAILVLMLSVIHVTLPDLKQPVDQMQFSGIAPFLGLALATTLILSQVLRICSALGGGITLTSISAVGQIANSALQKSGVAAAGRFMRDKAITRFGGGKKPARRYSGRRSV